MIRLSEEQRAILRYYSSNKREIVKKLQMAIPFIEDMEMREISEELIVKIEKMDEGEYMDVIGEDIPI